MHCCLIGGAGFIGMHLVRQLLDTGRTVTVLGRRPFPPDGFPAGATYVPGGYGGHLTLRELLKTADEVIDLAYATVPQTSYADPVFDILANLPPAVGLFEEARTAGLRRMIIVSSGGTVYGHAERWPIAETAATFPVSPYGITKLTIEKYALMFHRLHGLPVTIVRPANAYGEGQRPFTGQGFIATAMGSILKGDEVTVFGERGTIRDYVHVRDVAAGIVAALDCGEAGGIYNIGSGIGRDNVQVLDLIEPLVRACGRDLRIRRLPARAFDVAANVLDSTRLHDCSGWRAQTGFEEGLAGLWASIAAGAFH